MSLLRAKSHPALAEVSGKVERASKLTEAAVERAAKLTEAAQVAQALPRVARCERVARRVRLGPRGGLDRSPLEELGRAPKKKGQAASAPILPVASAERQLCPEPDAAAGSGIVEDGFLSDERSIEPPKKKAKKKKAATKRTKQMRYVYDARGHRAGKNSGRSQSLQSRSAEESPPPPPAPPPKPGLPPRPDQPSPAAKPQSVMLSLAEPGALRRPRPQPPKLDRLQDYSPPTPSAPSFGPPGSAGGQSQVSAGGKSYARPTPHFAGKLSSFERPPRRTSAVEELRELVTRFESLTPAAAQFPEGKPQIQRLAHLARKLEVDALSSKIGSPVALPVPASPASATPVSAAGGRPKTLSPSAADAHTPAHHRMPPTPQSAPRSSLRAASPLPATPLSPSPSHGQRRKSRQRLSDVSSGSRGRPGTTSDETPVEGSHVAVAESPAGQKRDSMKAVFRRLKDSDGELHRDSLPRALELLGYVSPEMEWVRNAYDALTKYSTLDMDEFMRFVAAYEAQQESSGAGLFAEYDADGSGLIDEVELEQLLASMGITPLDYVVKGILVEVCAPVDEKGTIEISYNEFRRLLEIIRIREGFTSQEVDEFQSVFNLFDRKKDGELQTSFLMGALSYLGYALPMNEVAGIKLEVDVDQSGTISEQEFLVCMRKVREREIARIRNLVGLTEDQSLKELRICPSKLKDVLISLGYLPIDDALSDAAEDAGVPQGTINHIVTFGQLWAFLEIYRRREGFSRKEISGIDAIFKEFDVDDNGVLDETEVGRMFRSMGLSVSYNAVRKLLAEIDRDGSHTIDVSEFRKLVRKYYVFFSKKVELSFTKATSDQARAKKELTSEQLMQLLQSAGLQSSIVEDILRVKARKKLGTGGNVHIMDFPELYSIAHEIQQALREVLIRNSGFTDAEVDQLRQRFHWYDKDGNGELEGAELRCLLKDIFPYLASDRDRRSELVEYITRADKDGSGTLDFDDFLRLARECRDLQDRVEREREVEAMQHTGFTLEEVSEFRELFCSDTERNEVSIDELMDLLSPVIPLGAKNLAKLNTILTEEFLEEKKAKDTPKSLRFWEFLRLVRRLLDEDFAGIANLRVGITSV